MAQPATRIGDADIPHCSPMVRGVGLSKVFINGIPWSSMTHINVPHLKPVPGIPPCVPHVAPIAKGSISVIPVTLNGGRLGDIIATCTAVAMGSLNVFIGG